MEASERLIESAQDLLWDRGYVGMSPRAVQLAAAAGQGSMYHHFAGKEDLAVQALRRSAAQLREAGEAALSGPGTAFDRISAYLLRERDVLRGCRLGGLAQDPEVYSSASLREPVEATFAWLTRRLAGVVREGQDAGELAVDLDPDATAAAIAAVLQGGYVLARAAGDEGPFHAAIAGVLALLASHVPDREPRGRITSGA